MYAAQAVAWRSSSSWTWSPVEDARADDQGRRAVELGRRLRPGGLLEPLERPRAEHPEAPRIGQVVVRRPARELEQLVERLAGHRVGPEGLVRAPASRIAVLDAPSPTTVPGRPPGRRSAGCLVGSGSGEPAAIPEEARRSGRRQRRRTHRRRRRPVRGPRAIARGRVRSDRSARSPSRRTRARPGAPLGGRRLRPARLARAAAARRLSARCRRPPTAHSILSRRQPELPAGDGCEARDRPSAGARGTAASGNGSALDREQRLPVTQTGVWSLDDE